MDSLAQNKGSGQVIQCGISDAFLNKVNVSGKQSAFGYSFNPAALSPDSFVRRTLAGKAFTVGYFSGNRRTNTTFISSELIALDYDNDVSVADALSNPFVREYALLVYATPSSTAGCHKTRVLFRLSEPVEHPERWRAMARALAEHVGLNVDPASWKPAQLYYGSTNRIEQPHINLEAVLPAEYVGALTADHSTTDYLRETTRQTHVTLDPTSPRAERYAAATIDGAIRDYLALPAKTKVRHNAYIKLAARLIGMKFGGWPCLENVDSQLTDAGRATDRPEREITDAIQWAYKNAEVIPLTLPDDDQDTAEPAPAKHSAWFTLLPDSWREAILNYLKPSHAPIIELFFQAVEHDLINPQDWTAPDLAAANAKLGFGIPETTLRRAIDELLTVIFLPKCPTKESPQGILVGHFGQNSARRRKATRYALAPYAAVRTILIEYANPRIYERASDTHEGDVLMPPTAGMMESAGIGQGEAAAVASELDAALASAYQAQGNKQESAVRRAKRSRARMIADLDNWHSTPLPEGWPLGSAAHYRAAYAHAKVKADPDTPRSRRQLAEMTGIDPHSVKALRARAGIKAQSAESAVEVQSFDDVRTYGKQHRAFAKSVTARSASGQTEVPDPDESYAAFITRQRAIGAKVYAHFQHTSTHEIVREAPPAPAERKPREYVEGITARPAEHVTEPKPERYYGPGYDPRWIMKQLQLALKLLGWLAIGDSLVNPQTGECAPETPREMIETIIGRELDDSWEGFTDLAAELESVATVRERNQTPPGDGWREIPLKRAG